MGATKRERPADKVREYIENSGLPPSIMDNNKRDVKKKKTALVMVRLDPDDYEELKSVARDRGISASTYLRILLKDALKSRY